MPRPFQNFGQNISSLAPEGKAGRGPGMTRYGTMLAFLNTPTFPVFSPPTFFTLLLSFGFTFLLSVILLLSTVLLCTNIPLMRTDTCNKPHTLRDAVTGRNRNRNVCKKSQPVMAFHTIDRYITQSIDGAMNVFNFCDLFSSLINY